MSPDESTAPDPDEGSHEPAARTTSDGVGLADGDRSTTEDEENSPDLAMELEVLREENRRLYESYRRARRSTYRRTTLGFLATGVLATVGAALFPTLRTVLLALGGAGVFAALLTYLITPERFVSDSVSDAVYRQLAATLADVTGELGLERVRVYVPRGTGDRTARLFVPQRADWKVPADEALDAAFVVTADEAERGLSTRPTGAALFDEFERATGDPLPERPAALVASLREAVVEQFELASAADVDLDADDGRLSLRTSDPAYADLGSFDHPVVSFIAVGLAQGLDQPVRVVPSANQADDLVTLRWTVDDADPDGAGEGSDENP